MKISFSLNLTHAKECTIKGVINKQGETTILSNEYDSAPKNINIDTTQYSVMPISFTFFFIDTLRNL